MLHSTSESTGHLRINISLDDQGVFAFGMSLTWLYWRPFNLKGEYHHERMICSSILRFLSDKKTNRIDCATKVFLSSLQCNLKMSFLQLNIFDTITKIFNSIRS